MANLGAGMDVVSEGELRRARAAGVPPDKIIFAGVGKTREEMAYALKEAFSASTSKACQNSDALSEVATGLGRPPASPSASILTSTPKRTPRYRPESQRTNSACRIAERRPLCRSRRPARHRRSPASTCISAARSPIWRHSAQAFPLMRELSTRPCAPTAITFHPSRYRRRPRRALSRHQ